MTRLHVRYDAQSFPEDLAFIETKDRTNFQGRYVLRHPFKGKSECDAGKKYQASLPARFKREAVNLAYLTGWKQSEIEARMETAGQSVKGEVASAKGRDPPPGRRSWVGVQKRRCPIGSLQTDLALQGRKPPPAIAFTSALPGNTFAASA